MSSTNPITIVLDSARVFILRFLERIKELTVLCGIKLV